jgi:hypothetical protein
MTCKHRWEEINYAYRYPAHYLYRCTRCNSFIGALLKENPSPKG